MIESIQAFIQTILREAANGNFSFFILAAAIVQIIIMCKGGRRQ